MPTPLAEPVADNAGVSRGVIEIARVLGFAGMLAGISTGVGLAVFAMQHGSVAGAIGGVLVAAASSCFDLFGEVVLVRVIARRFERRAGSALRGAGRVHALVNIEPEATVRSIKRVPDEIAVLELVPRSGRLALEGVLGRAEVRAEHRPTILARKQHMWPVVELHYLADGQRLDLVLYQQPSFVRTFALMLGHLRVVRHPSDRLADRMRLALEGVALPGRNVPEVLVGARPAQPVEEERGRASSEPSASVSRR